MILSFLVFIEQEFDKLAQRQGVFKVETIGDSYMCVTGLPEEQQDHAIRMVKFAAECLDILSFISEELTEKVKFLFDLMHLCMVGRAPLIGLAVLSSL